MASLAYCWETGPIYQSWKRETLHTQVQPTRTSGKLGWEGARQMRVPQGNFWKSRQSQQHASNSAHK